MSFISLTSEERRTRPHMGRKMGSLMHRPKRSPSHSTHAQSLDDLVGAGEDQWRNSKAERVCSLEIDYQLEGCRPLHWKIGRLLPRENPSGVNACLAMEGQGARSLAGQAAGSGRFAPRIDRRNGMTRCQRHELVAAAAEERIGADDERSGR